MTNRKVVITGDAGFIGASLARELAPNNSAIIIDNLCASNKENLTDLLAGNVEFVKGQIRAVAWCRKEGK